MPDTVATQVAVCAVVMEEGVATTVTLVTVGWAIAVVMATIVFPSLVWSWVEVAVMVSDPEAVAVEGAE